MADVRIDDHSREYLRQVEEALGRAMEGIGIQIEGEAKEELENSPKRVDTGLLRNSITYALDGEPPAISSYSGSDVHGNTEVTRKNKTAGKPAPPPRDGKYSGSAPKESKGRAVYIGTNVEYALYVHEGTVNMTANRFLKNAVERNTDQIKQYVKDALS